MSLYHILLSTMLPNNTHPFDHGFSDTHSQYASGSAYSDAMLSDDLSTVDFGSTTDPFANSSSPPPSTSSSQYLTQSMSPSWTQGYSAYNNSTQHVHPSATPAHPWQSPVYPQVQPEGPHSYNQGFGSGMNTQQTTSMGYQASMPTVQASVPVRYPTEIAIGQSQSVSWTTSAMEASGSTVGLQQGTHLSNLQQGPFTTVPMGTFHSPAQTAAAGQRRSSSSPTTPTTPVRRRSPAESIRYGSAPDSRLSSSRQPRSSSRTPCCWGGFCGTKLDTLPIAAISHHLKEAHIDRTAWDGRARVVCQWSSGGSPCGMEMYYDNIGKHIAAVHLGSTALTCPYCDKTFSRGDSLCRHVREACRHAQ